MWENEYQVEQDDIKAPEFLKVKALQKMKDSRGDSSNIFKLKPVLGMAFSCLVIMVVVLNWARVFERESELMTNLVFERMDGGLRYFTGIGHDDVHLVELKEVETTIGVFGSELYLDNFRLEGASWVVGEDDARVHYVFEREDSTIRVMINNHTDFVSTNSILNDFPLALYYQTMLLQTTFIAEFLYDDIYYQIEATGLTEDEFIDNLQKIINWLPINLDGDLDGK